MSNGTDDVTTEVDDPKVRDGVRHLRLGELVEEFYDGLSSIDRKMVEGFLPVRIVQLLKDR